MKTFLRFTSIALVALAAVVASAPPAGAQAPETLFVCEEVGACQYSSIQSAVNAAKAGDTIRVRSGIYWEHVTIPAGKDGLTLRGAQAGVPAAARVDAPRAQESWLFGDSSGTALSVASSGVTVDGFLIAAYDQGIRSTPSTSGLQVVNNNFGNVGNSVIPDSNGEQETAVRNNAFYVNVDRGATKGFAIVSGASHGRGVVAGNLITGEGTLLGSLRGPGARRDGRGQPRNRLRGPLARLERVDGAVIEGNVVDGPESTGPGGPVRHPRRRRQEQCRDRRGRRLGVLLNAGGAREPGPRDRGQRLLGLGAAAGGLRHAGLRRRYARRPLQPLRHGRAGSGRGTARSRSMRGTTGGDATRGPNQPDCATLERSQGAIVRTVPQLTLSIETAGSRIVNASGGTTTFRASLLRDSDGTLHEARALPAHLVHGQLDIRLAGRRPRSAAPRRLQRDAGR